MPDVEIDITDEERKLALENYLRIILSKESYSVYEERGVEAGIFNEAIIKVIELEMKERLSNE